MNIKLNNINNEPYKVNKNNKKLALILFSKSELPQLPININNGINTASK